MSRMVQIRNVPEDLHRTLKARAALEGLSLSDYLLNELRRVAERPTRKQLLERLAQHPREALASCAAELVREERERR